MRPAVVCALWWNILTTEIFSRKLRPIRRTNSTFRKKKFGKYSSRWWGGSSLSMTLRSSTETWSRQTFSYTKMEQPSWVTWMSLRSPKKAYYILKPVLHTTQVLRFGAISHMITNQIFGPSDAFYTSQLHWSLLLGPRTCKVFTRKFWEAFIRKYPTFSQTNLLRQSNSWYKLLHRWDQAVIRFSTCL